MEPSSSRGKEGNLQNFPGEFHFFPTEIHFLSKVPVFVLGTTLCLQKVVSQPLECITRSHQKRNQKRSVVTAASAASAALAPGGGGGPGRRRRRLVRRCLIRRSFL